jgi:phosphotriesterase-related protein
MTIPSTKPPLTILGEPIRDDYDLVLAHEHLFLDLRSSLVEMPQCSDDAVREISRTNAEQIRSTNPFGYAANLVLDDDDDAVREELDVLSGLRVLIVDVTPDTLGGSPERLAGLSRLTGMDILSGCGPYVESSWPRWLHDMSQDQLTERIVTRFSGECRPSVIGEIGFGSTEAESRSLRAAAVAQRELDVPLYVHVSPWHPLGHEALDLVEREGADVERVVVCHLDVSVATDVGYARSLLDRGCYIALDIWGNDASHGARSLPTDEVRAAATVALTAVGHGERVLHSHDICTKTQLARFGGPGYGHLHSRGRALLLAAGLDEGQINDQLVRNPLRLLGGEAALERSSVGGNR